MNTTTNDRRDYRLALGFLVGTAVGAGVMMWLAPQAAAELRQRVIGRATRLGERAQAVRDGVAERVARGAQQVERLANSAKSTT